MKKHKHKPENTNFFLFDHFAFLLFLLFCSLLVFLLFLLFLLFIFIFSLKDFFSPKSLALLDLKSTKLCEKKSMKIYKENL